MKAISYLIISEHQLVYFSLKGHEPVIIQEILYDKKDKAHDS